MIDIVTDGGPWETASASISDAIDTVDKKRNQFEPVFNPEETTLMQILKGERGEQLVEALRIRLVDLLNATASKNITQTLAIQKNALLALADVGGKSPALSSLTATTYLIEAYLCIFSGA